MLCYNCNWSTIYAYKQNIVHGVEAASKKTLFLLYFNLGMAGLNL